MPTDSPTRYLHPPRKGWGLYYDPLYGYIPVDSLIREAMDLPSVQRLRNIKQLSTVYLIFPGAVHSRFEHSVGVYYLASRAYETLKKNYFAFDLEQKWPIFEPEYEKALKLAALFHDIGHGPWSHAFELFTHTNEDYRELTHEKVTQKLIKDGFGEYDDIPMFLNREIERLREKGRPDKYIRILKPENIANMAIGFPPPSDEEYTFLSNIISMKPVDVDRMDYLRRDALHTGIETGRFDVWELMHSYTLARGRSRGQWVIRFEKEAAGGIESLTVCRDITYRKVYYNSVHRTTQEMIVRALYELVVDKEALKLDDLIMLTDDELLTVFKSSKGTSFTADVADRVKWRGVYEPFPIKINVNNDLDNYSKIKWGELALISPQSRDLVTEWFKSEIELSRKLNLPHHQRVIFDIRAIPITDSSEYDRALFFDYRTNRQSSLLDELPHLEATTKSMEIRKNYIEKISNLMISIPFDYLQEIIDSYKDEILKKGEIPDKDKVVQKLYEEKFNLVIRQLMEFLGLREAEKQKALSEKFKKVIEKFLFELF